MAVPVALVTYGATSVEFAPGLRRGASHFFAAGEKIVGLHIFSPQAKKWAVRPIELDGSLV
jgi:hypothetical protein